MEKIKQHQKIPSSWSGREELRSKGQFWTPDWVAEAMVSYVIQGADLVFDPAAGEGAFYKSLKKLAPSLPFYGTDIDPQVLLSPEYRGENCFLEHRDFIRDAPRRKFRAIVGNPPYIRHHRIDEPTKQYLKHLSLTKTGFSLDGRAGLHIYFLIQALELLEDDGRLAFIMPSDTCEGKSAQPLWKWITSKYCVDGVATFESQATPFPNVDTNAILFFIRKSPQKETINWCKVKKPESVAFRFYVENEFQTLESQDIEIEIRDLEEALKTGFSRPRREVSEKGGYTLCDFAQVLRGIATGSNEYFFLTRKQIEEYSLKENYFKRAIGRTGDVEGDVISQSDLQALEARNRPTYLLSIPQEHKLDDRVLSDYLQHGLRLDLPNRPLLKQRQPWYKMEKREVPPLLFAYLGRRDIRFILNEAKVLPLTAFLCVYPLAKDDKSILNLWKALNHPDTLANLKFVGKSYGSQAIKVEPGSLRNLPIPAHIVDIFDLHRSSKTLLKQPSLF